MMEHILQAASYFGEPLFVLVFTLFLVCFIDAFVPVMPTAIAIVVFLTNPTGEFAVMILLASVAGEVLGNTVFYLLIKKFGTPKFAKKMIDKYADFLVVKGEKILLINRVTPLVPIVAPFIANCNWSYRKSMCYIAFGSMVKNGLLLFLATCPYYLFSQYFAKKISIGVLAIIILLSFILSKQRKLRVKCTTV